MLLSIAGVVLIWFALKAAAAKACLTSALCVAKWREKHSLPGHRCTLYRRSLHTLTAI